MPEFSLTGVASWQSEKTELDLNMPEKVNIGVDLGKVIPNLSLPTVNVPVSIPRMTIPVSDQDRYNVSLSLKQALWAGGRVKAGKEMAKTEIDMMHAGLDAQLYEIKDKVKQIDDLLDGYQESDIHEIIEKIRRISGEIIEEL